MTSVFEAGIKEERARTAAFAASVAAAFAASAAPVATVDAAATAAVARNNDVSE